MASPTTASTPASSQQDQVDSIVLTPSRKVKALLAQFDDSDSDQGPPGKNLQEAPKHLGTIEKECTNVEFDSESPLASKSDGQGPDGRVLSRGPRGHLAARMQAAPTNNYSDPSGKDSGANAYARIKNQIAQTSKPKATVPHSTDNGSSGDELQSAGPKRKLLQKKNIPAGDYLPRQETRSPSPMFFPSPTATKGFEKSPPMYNSQHESDSEELPEDPLKQSGSKFLALVEKHRKQRLAREAADEAKRAERLEQLKKGGSRGCQKVGVGTLGDVSDGSDNSDVDVGRRFTQQARPTRKAGKKALEEMSRETQRMSRSMQLAHQATTKKKITKESLLARFNFTTPRSSTGQSADTGHFPTTVSSTPASDAEGRREESTPPTSPLPVETDKELALEVPTAADPAGALVATENEGVPASGNLLTLQPTALEKGKAKAIAVDEMIDATTRPVQNVNELRVRPIRVRWSKQDAVIARGGDSDSDLEIVTSHSKFKKFAAFESIPRQRSRETSSHLVLRSLAHLQTGIADDKHASVSAAQMEAHLRRAARMQAQKEREEKLEELRSRGILTQTAEERQQEQEEVEDLVERARVEGAEIQRREKEMAKKDGTFVKDELDDDEESDDEEDADFQDETEQIEDHVSGSEEEVYEESEVDQEGDVERNRDFEGSHTPDREKADVVDEEADKTVSEEGLGSVCSDDEDGGKSEKEYQPLRLHARSRRTLVVGDDEDDEEDVKVFPTPQTTETPQSVLRSARKVIPGLQMSDDLPICLTQAFAATMADSGTQGEELATQEQDSLTLTRDLPSPHFTAVPSLDRLESVAVIVDSQPATQTQPLDLDLSITQTQAIPQSPAGMSSTQFSFIPTQDVGYVMSPFKEGRFDTPLPAPHSTIDTVILPQEEQSPILQRTGRLRRRRATASSDGEAVNDESRLSGLGLDKSAFAIMQRAAKDVDHQTIFDKSKSHAREVVDEAAEESEDEYAGLGGASDDDEGEEDEADQRIIDHDETLGQGDESKLAGFYA